jgi:hypothetical protein
VTKSRHILPPRVFWSDDEDAFLRRFFGRVPASDMAQVLDRSRSSTHQRCRVLGLSRRLTPTRAPAFRRRLLELHALGWSDAEIAVELKVERHTVGDHRALLGLPMNRFSAHVRQRVAEKTREQLEKAGLRSLAELRLRTWRERARAAGWPEDLAPQYVRILTSLYERGPQSRRQLCDSAGFTWKNGNGRGSMCGGGRTNRNVSYLAELMRRGLVVYSGRSFKGRGKGSSFGAYSLALPVALARSQSA